jgi:hypothetical protein
MKMRERQDSSPKLPRADYQHVGLLANVKFLKHKRIYIRKITYFGPRDSVVGTETRYGLDGSNPVRSDNFRAVQTSPETHLTCTMGTKSLSRWKEVGA